MTRENRQRTARRPEASPPAAPRHVEGSRAPRVREKRRRRRLRFFYFFLFLTVLSAAVVLSLTVLFQVDTIQVTGSSRYSQEEIVKASGLKTGENLFLTGTKGAKAALESKLPYLEDVKVSRRLPAKLVIQVKQAGVAGAASFQGRYVLLSDSGKVLELANRVPSGCTVLNGLAFSSAVPGKQAAYKSKENRDLYSRVIGAIRENKLDKVTKIDISSPYRILVEYDGRITMNLGNSSDLEYKLRFGRNVLDTKDENGNKNIGDEEKGVLNLSSAKDDDRAYFDPDASGTSQPSSGASSAANSSSR